MRPHDVEIFFREFRIGLRIEKNVRQQHVAGALQSRRKFCILIARNLKLVHLLYKRGSRVGSDFFFQSFKGLLRGITLGVGKGDVKRDHARSARAQLIHEPRVVVSGKRE